MQVEKVFELAAFIREQIKQTDAVVVTHGTDTLEESAFLLSLLLPSTRPVVLVGAMKASNASDGDGAGNLKDALEVAVSSESINRGVLLVMAGEIHAAAEVHKHHSTNLDALQSPRFGPLGTIQGTTINWRMQPAQRHALPRDKEIVSPAKVELLTAHHESDASLVKASVALGVQGLVIQGLGAGNLPPAMARAVLETIQENIPVVICTRCGAGGAVPLYGYEGGGAYLKKHGALISRHLNGPKARIALSLLLTQRTDRKTLEAFFEA